MSKTSGPSRLPQWSFALGRGRETQRWVGSEPPPVVSLGSVRRVKGQAHGRGVPTWAYSVTMGCHLRLESGIEHDLVRWLDQESGVDHLLPQPAQIHYEGPRARVLTHTPDLLSVGQDGVVTVWDARPAEKQDDGFLAAAEATRQACRELGWDYRVFSGIPTLLRVNLLWLDGFRLPQPWYASAWSTIAPTAGAAITIGEVLVADGGQGHVLSAMWHQIRHRRLQCDLESPLSAATRLTAVA